MALDVGDRRVGVALSDETGTVAAPLTTLDRDGDRSLLQEIQACVSQYDVAEVVVGVPYNIDGTMGIQARKVMRFVDKLKAGVKAQVRTWDESLSTRRARSLGSARKGRRFDKGEIDRRAAAVILQEYLELGRKAG